MPQKSWAVGEEVLAADFNTYVQQQVVPQFTTAAQRDSQWASPPNGARCVTVDTNTEWQRINNTWYAPFQVLGSADTTGNSGAISAEVTIGNAVAVTLPAQRRLLLSAYVRGVNGSVATAAGFLRIKEGATVLQEAQIGFWSSLAGPSVLLTRSLLVAQGAHTYTIAGTCSGGTMVTQAAATFPMQLVVTDGGAS